MYFKLQAFLQTDSRKTFDAFTEVRYPLLEIPQYDNELFVTPSIFIIIPKYIPSLLISRSNYFIDLWLFSVIQNTPFRLTKT